MAKIDCSMVLGFVHEAARLCDTYRDCDKCPMARRKKCPMVLLDYDDIDVQSVVDALQAWSDEHPVKTRLDDFREKYPNASLDTGNGCPHIRPAILGYCSDCFGCSNKVQAPQSCWHEPLDGGATGKAVEDSGEGFYDSDIGKTVFTTSEAAEAALKARENK